jgi:hypothetical protein
MSSGQKWLFFGTAPAPVVSLFGRISTWLLRFFRIEGFEKDKLFGIFA